MIVEQNNSKDILLYLMNDPKLKDYHEVAWHLSKLQKEIFHYRTCFQLRDENGFVIEKIDPGDGEDFHATMRHYDRLVKIAYLPVITQIINSSYVKGKISPKIILESGNVEILEFFSLEISHRLDFLL